MNDFNIEMDILMKIAEKIFSSQLLTKSTTTVAKVIFQENSIVYIQGSDS